MSAAHISRDAPTVASGEQHQRDADVRRFGFAAEYDVERKFRETRLYQVAPISTNLFLSYTAEHVLDMARSF
jgi:alkylation response protein AidB-like acyl-CoA dehydrogenase